jgi:hypothetical protein
VVLLGIRTAFKEDVQALVAEHVYGEPLRITGEVLTPTAEPVDPAHIITELRQHMVRIRHVAEKPHPSSATFVHTDLEKCTHVFLRQYAPRRVWSPLQRPLLGPITKREGSATPGTLHIAAWPSEHQHKRHITSAHNVNSNAHWFSRGIVTRT